MAIEPPTPTLEPPASVRVHPAMGAENFHVLSRFVPPALRDDFAAVYAFCRAADDIADEHPGTDESRAAALDELTRWRALLVDAHAFARGERSEPPDHPVFTPLAHTMRRRALDASPFHDLLDAFEQDQRVTRYDTWEQLLEYCARSANPVGRILLAMMVSAVDSSAPSPRGRGWTGAARPGEGTLDNETLKALLADSICTALQLANFWQDVRRDLLDRDRVYLPRLDTGVDADMVRRWAATPDDPNSRVAYIRALRPLVQRTRDLLDHGRALPAMIDDPDLARVVRLFILGGDGILSKIEHVGCATLWGRPTLAPFDKAAILLRSRASPHPPSNPDRSPALDHALRRCAQVTRREARNFYYGLRLTPQPARSALYAVYAWMRDADDDADGHTGAPPVCAYERLRRRRERLRALVERDDLRSAHPAWIGLAWALREFPIDAADLFALLDGLEEDANHAGYAARDDLRAYCERVASTVGRVCLAVWGLHPKADPLVARERATARGVAFQLINILRDVRRDHAGGRIYIPRDDLARFGVTPTKVAEWSAPDAASALVRDVCAWARRELAFSEGLELAILPGGAAPMRAMTGIYTGVLAQIERDPSLVACEPRAALPVARKLRITLAAMVATRPARIGR